MKGFVIIILLFSTGLYGQYQSAGKHYAGTIEGRSIKEHVYTLASDEFQGRETGTEGNLKAADYIALQFASFGIEPIPGDDDYFQEVAFSTVKWGDLSLTVNGERIEHLKEYLSVPQYFPVTTGPTVISALTFLGYGIDDPVYSDYAGVDVRGKHLLVYSGEPWDKNENFLISGSDSASNWSIDPLLKLETARKAGAASIWIIEDNLREMIMYARKYLLTGAMLMGDAETMTKEYLPHATISSSLGQKLAGKKVKKVIRLRDKITRTGKPAHTLLPVNMVWNAAHQIKSTPGVNVLAYIEGIDPSLKKELVIVTAHYDHLGMRGKDIFYGADDNASGTSAVLEIAQAFAEAKAQGQGPMRSVLCMLVTGEEKGLLGSQYYSEHPIFPLEHTIANVNIDMIGRIDDAHTDSNYTYVIGSDRLSTDLHKINESVNEQYTKLQLDYTYNKEDDPHRFYYRSDHYNFAKNGIPAIFYFSGVHDDYHRPTDTPDKLMYDKAETIARLAFYTTWELANRKERIKVDVFGKS